MRVSAPALNGEHGPDRVCAVIFFEGYLGVSPTVLNLARSLADSGYRVILYVSPTAYPAAGRLSDGIEVEEIQPPRLVNLLRGLRGPVLARLGRLSHWLQFAWFAQAIVRHMRGERRRARRRPVCVGVDLWGGVVAALLRTLLDLRYVFLSLEVKKDPRSFTGLRRGWGWLARDSFRRAEAVIAQGADRFEVLRQQYGWTHPTLLSLPNGPRAHGSAGTASPGLLRARLAIPIDRRIALQAGMICPTTCSEQLARGFRELRDWALVLHERHARSPEDPYLQLLRKRNSQNLFLSLQPVAYDDLPRLIADATIGLAFYAAGPEDLNFYNISASGKLPHYLAQGKPVLVSGQPSLMEIVEEFKCGLAIRDPADGDELRAALESLTLSYEAFAANARECFRVRFDFDTGARIVIQKLDQLSEPSVSETPDAAR